MGACVVERCHEGGAGLGEGGGKVVSGSAGAGGGNGGRNGSGRRRAVGCEGCRAREVRKKGLRDI